MVTLNFTPLPVVAGLLLHIVRSSLRTRDIIFANGVDASRMSGFLNSYPGEYVKVWALKSGVSNRLDAESRNSPFLKMGDNSTIPQITRRSSPRH